MFNTKVFFNNYDLSSLPGVKVVNYDTLEMPARVLNTSKLARANKSLLTSAEYSAKTVTVTGFVGGVDHNILQANYDRLKGYIQDQEGIVRVMQGGSDVEYVGTLNGISKSYIGKNIAFTLSFLCSNPIGRSATGFVLLEPTVITTATLTTTFVIEGSFAAAPRFNVTVTSVTGGTNKSISLLNGATSKGIRITRNWLSGDIMSINSDTMEVLVNSMPQDFEGQFPSFLPGSRTLQYIDDFTTRNITLQALYAKQYS